MSQKDSDRNPPTPPESLLKLQRRFADHIRDPDSVAPVSGIEERRLVIYRRLFFNNISNLMAKNFPVLRRLYSDDDWNGLIRAFLRDHRAETPLFPQIGQEMVRFLSVLQAGDRLPYPFLAELAHWEYVETCVRFDESEPCWIDPGPDIDPDHARPVLNPTLRLAIYQWPVHRIGPRFLPAEPGASQVVLLAYRRRDDSVAFKEINLLTAHLIELMQASPDLTGLELMKRIAVQLPQVDADRLKQQGLALLASLHQGEVILTLVQPSHQDMDRQRS
ncbi:MAG: DUF2063 domain-containing protein [Wenzhouxiangella sp.]|nr:MAG: DUF2063 domain-containing protein [Wenzhouxiangella sp.]